MNKVRQQRHGNSVKDCLHCGKLLEKYYVPDGKKRVDSAFCDNECRNGHHSLLRKIERKKATATRCLIELLEIANDTKYSKQALRAVDDTLFVTQAMRNKSIEEPVTGYVCGNCDDFVQSAKRPNKCKKCSHRFFRRITPMI